MRISIQTICLVLLTAIAGFTALHFAKGLFAPVLAAIMLGIVMSPLSELWDRVHVPPALAAALSVAVALLVILVLILLIEPYLSAALRQAPVIQAELRDTLQDLRATFAGLQKVSEDMAAAIEPTPATGSEEESDKMALPTLTDALFYAPQFLAQFLIFTGTLYFFLLTRREIYLWLNQSIEGLAKEDLSNAAYQVSRYVLAITFINFGLGVAVTIAMQAVGMPSPILWGLLAFILNYIMYLGPACLIVSLAVTGIVVFEGPYSFLPAALYIALNATEAQFVTPTLLGRSLSVNPLLVFLSLVFWLWLWGPIGGIIAIPMLIWLLTVFKGNAEAMSPHATRLPAPVARN